MVSVLDSGLRGPGSSPGRVIVLCCTSKLPGKPDKMLGVTCNGLASHPGEVALFLVAQYCRNRDKLQLCGPLGSCADFIYQSIWSLVC